jgi:hypothetical protein
MWKTSFGHDKIFFSKSLLMNIHMTDHIYKIAVRRKCVWKYFFLREFSSAAPSNGSPGGVSSAIVGVVARQQWQLRRGDDNDDDNNGGGERREQRGNGHGSAAPPMVDNTRQTQHWRWHQRLATSAWHRPLYLVGYLAIIAKRHDSLNASC